MEIKSKSSNGMGTTTNSDLESVSPLTTILRKNRDTSTKRFVLHLFILFVAGALALCSLFLTHLDFFYSNTRLYSSVVLDN